MQWIHSFNRKKKFLIAIQNSFELITCNATKSMIEQMKIEFFQRKRIKICDKMLIVCTKIFAHDRKIETFSLKISSFEFSSFEFSSSKFSSFENDKMFVDRKYFNKNKRLKLIANNNSTMFLISLIWFVKSNKFVKYRVVKKEQISIFFDNWIKNNIRLIHNVSYRVMIFFFAFLTEFLSLCDFFRKNWNSVQFVDWWIKKFCSKWFCHEISWNFVASFDRSNVFELKWWNLWHAINFHVM